MSDDDLFWFPASGSAPADEDAVGASPAAPVAPVVRERSRRGTAALLAATAFVFGGGGVAIGAEVINHHNSSPISGSGLTVGTVNPASLTSNPRSYAAIASK